MAERADQDTAGAVGAMTAVPSDADRLDLDAIEEHAQCVFFWRTPRDKDKAAEHLVTLVRAVRALLAELAAQKELTLTMAMPESDE